MFPTDFIGLAKEIYPRWAQAPRWAKFIGAQMQQCDDLVERMKRTIGARLIEKAPDDALESIGSNYALSKPIQMTLQRYRQYLRSPFERWYYSSTNEGLAAEIKSLGYPSVGVITWRMLVDGGFDPFLTFGGNSSFFYILIRKPNPWAPAGKWGEPPLGSGALWDAAPFTWGSTATPTEIDEIRRTVQKFKPAGMSCRFIEAWLEVDLFGLPTDIVRWPVHEDWEYESNGGAKSYYNKGVFVR